MDSSAYRSTQPLASQARDKVKTQLSPTLVRCSLLCFHLEEQMVVGRGPESQNPCVCCMHIMVAISLESLFSFVESFPGRFMNRILMLKHNPKDPTLCTEGMLMKAACERSMHTHPYAFVLSIRSHFYSQINGD